jgi:hypothetical protein
MKTNASASDHDRAVESSDADANDHRWFRRNLESHYRVRRRLAGDPVCARPIRVEGRPGKETIIVKRDGDRFSRVSVVTYIRLPQTPRLLQVMHDLVSYAAVAGHDMVTWQQAVDWAEQIQKHDQREGSVLGPSLLH